MSAVMLRCPNCGTTRATPGECEACHEAQVRHYCNNHRTGLWLKSGTCGQCGAEFGALARPHRASKHPSRRHLLQMQRRVLVTWQRDNRALAKHQKLTGQAGRPGSASKR